MENLRYEMFNQRSEQVKFNAFFQYLKSFSEAGLDTLQKLENQFNKEMRKKLKHCQALSTIKNLMSSYQIFILQIKDSCDFVEISQFGYCIGKTFVQLLKIIKWFLKTWLKDTRKFEKAKASLQSEGIDEVSNAAQQNICAFCEQLIKANPYGRQAKAKRRGVGINDIGGDLRQAKLTHKKQLSHLMNMKENIMEKTSKQIASRSAIDLGEMDILNRKHIAMKLQISNNEMVLEEVLNEFNMKTEAMSRFVSNTQASCIQNFKMNQQNDYLAFEEQMRVIITQKYNEAKQKLKNLVLQKIVEYQKHRKDKLTDKEMQTTNIDFTEKDKYEQKIKQLNTNCQRLKNQLQSEKCLSQSLKQLLESKSVQFQKQFLNFRKEIIQSDLRSKHLLKSLKSFKQGVQQSNIYQEQQGQQQQQQQSDHIQQTQGVLRKYISKIATVNGKEKSFKNKFSMKFSQSLNDDIINQSLPTVKFYKISNQISTQTDQVFILSSNIQPSLSQVTQQTIYAKSKETMKVQRMSKIISQKITTKKQTAHLYSHIKSKIKNAIQKEYVKPVKKDFKQSVSTCMGDMVKKLSVDYLFPRKKQVSLNPIQLFKIVQQPAFIQIPSYWLGKDDIINLFLNDKNAHNYECLIYRNSLFNLANVNQKRIINLSKQIQSTDIEWIAKRESVIDQSIESKIMHAFYYQLNGFKKRQKHIYIQLKHLLRSPYEISKKVDVIQLENNQIIQKDIQVGELKRMLNLILKFHGDCIGQEKDSICEHIVNFSLKIGIRFT